MSKNLRTTRIPDYIVLRECLRHAPEYRQHLALHGQDGDVIEHSYIVYDNSDPDIGRPIEKVTVTISYSDLFAGVKEISQKKREAIYWSVIMDEKQGKVADRLGIKESTVAQYVRSSCEMLSSHYFEKVESLVA